MRLHPEPIVILGMQRSGTSALAGALNRLGVHFGRPEMLYPADRNNPTGYFEPRKLTLFNLQCLAAFQLHPTSAGRLPDNWKEFPESLSLCAELQAFFSGEFDRRGRWGLKQPVTSLLLPLYREVFSRLGLRPHYVLCLRNPLETMRSEANLDYGDSYRVMAALGDRAIGSWLRYTLGPLEDLAGETVTVVPYERLLSDTRDVLQQIVQRHPEWTVGESDWEAAGGSVTPDLRHNQSAVEGLDAYPSLVRRTLETVSFAKCEDSGWWSEIERLCREFRDMVDLFSEPEPASKIGLSWFAGSERKVVEVPYDRPSSRQMLSIPVEAPPSTQINGLLVGRPARVWIWRCVWKFGSKEVPARLSAGVASRWTEIYGVPRLDAVLEPGQVMLTTPEEPGPYHLEIEFLVNAGPNTSDDTAAALASRLDRSIARGSTV